MEVIKYIPMGLFTLFASKLLILGNINLESCLVLLILAAVHTIYHLKLRLDSVKELDGKLSSLEAQIKEHKQSQEAALNDQRTQIAALKDGITGLKVASGMRFPQNVR